MRRKALMSTILISILLLNTATTVYAFSVWDLATNIVNPIGWIFYFYNATLWLESYIGSLQDVANWSYSQTKVSLVTVGSGYITYLYTVKDESERLKYYALARAKAIYVQSSANGSTPSEAMNKAIKVIDEMYENKIRELTDYQNVTVVFLEKTLPHYKQVCDLYKYKYNISSSSVESLSSVQAYNLWDTANTTETYKTYTYKVLRFHVYDYHGQWGWRYVRFKYISIDNKEVYNYTLFKECLDKLINDRQWVVDNLVNYFTQVNQLVESGQLNISEVADKVLDPYAIITMAKNDTTNKLAWSAYELALLGLKTNMTAPVTIDVNGTQYSGYLFASDGFNTTLEVNRTYTVPQGESVYLLTPDGKIVLLQAGDTFKLLNATDIQTGQELTSLTLTKYVDTSLEAQKILEDVEKLIELYNKTLELQTTVSGGSDGSDDWADTINDFWNSLDWQVKAVIIGGGILAGIVIIGRSFGKGGVSVIRMGK